MGKSKQRPVTTHEKSIAQVTLRSRDEFHSGRSEYCSLNVGEHDRALKYIHRAPGQERNYQQ